jgi:hypothetical protein
LTDTSPPGWPPGVEPIGVEGLDRIEIDREHQIYWDGRPIEIKRSIILTGSQKFIASVVTIVGVLAALATIATGVNNASVFLCARHIIWLSCPVL